MTLLFSTQQWNRQLKNIKKLLKADQKESRWKRFLTEKSTYPLTNEIYKLLRNQLSMDAKSKG